jgi:Tol biopolymer transport system component
MRHARTGLRASLAALLCLAACDTNMNDGDPPPPLTEVVSVNAQGQVAAGPSTSAAKEASISPDGRFVAFSSGAPGLDPAKTTTTLEIWLRDLQGRTTRRIVKTTDGLDPSGACSQPSVSADGNRIAFWSAAINLHADDADTIGDVIVRDLAADTTILVSRATGATGAKGNGNSGEPVISADGRYVAFTSQATNLDAADPDPTPDIYVRDLQTSTTTLISRASGAGGAKAAGTGSYGPAISTDGRFIAFYTDAGNLDASVADGNGIHDVYRRDWNPPSAPPVTVRVSYDGAGGDANGISTRPSISADGRYVAFESGASDLLSEADLNGWPDIFVRDLNPGGATVLASMTSSSDPSSGASALASISADGRFVAFESAASNLVEGDTNGKTDVFIRDLRPQPSFTTLRVSVGTYAVQGNDASSDPAVSGDGRVVVFTSGATNLAESDNNGVNDIFKYGPVY